LNIDFYKRLLVSLIMVMFVSVECIYAADNTSTSQPQKRSILSKLKLNKQSTKKKKAKITEIELPPVQGKPKIPFSQMTVMTIDDCVKYAIEHNPHLKVSEERIEAAKSGIGQARANYAPRFSVGYNLYHKNNQATQVVRSYDNAMGFNIGVSDTIWDFGRTTAKINIPLVRLTYKWADKVIAQQEEMHDEIISYTRIPAKVIKSTESESAN
jgi:hypothetical protein